MTTARSRNPWLQFAGLPPRIDTSGEVYREQLAMARRVGGRTKELYDNLATLREIMTQATELGTKMRDAGQGEDVADAARALNTQLTAIEGGLTQIEGESGQDALNFPGRLDNQYVVLYNFVIRGDRLPPRGAYERLDDLDPLLDELLGKLRRVFDTDLEAFNDLVRSKGQPPVLVSVP